MDVKALTDERLLSRTAKSCGPGAPDIRRQVRDDVQRITRATVANGMVHRGELV